MGASKIFLGMTRNQQVWPGLLWSEYFLAWCPCGKSHFCAYGLWLWALGTSFAWLWVRAEEFFCLWLPRTCSFPLIRIQEQVDRLARRRGLLKEWWCWGGETVFSGLEFLSNCWPRMEQWLINPVVTNTYLFNVEEVGLHALDCHLFVIFNALGLEHLRKCPLSFFGYQSVF